MNKSPRDRAYEASEALKRAADELRAQVDDLDLVLDALTGEAETLAEVGKCVGGPPGQICKRAASRLMEEEIDMLNAVRIRITEDAVQLIEDADEALQIPLPYPGYDGSA